MPKLSVIVITKNEEFNIGECLQSVRWADECIVIDSESTDRTVEIARTFGATVHVHPWEGFGKARNIALRYATGEWTFWLDADERSSEQLSHEILDTIAHETPEIDGYTMPRKAQFLGRWILHSGWYPGRVLRLFRTLKATYTDENVHEGVTINGRVGKLTNDILHYTDPNLFHYFEKFNRYTSLAAEDLQLKGKQFRPSQLIVHPIWLFIKMYILKRGFSDGLQGFILAVVSSCYVFTKYAKFWERVQHEKI